MTDCASRAFLLLAGLSLLAGCDRHPKQEVRPVAPKTSATAAPQNLDGLIRFDDPKECEFSEPMDRLFASLIHAKPDYTISAGRPEIPRAFAAAFGKVTSKTDSDGLLTVSMPVRGTWKCLRVVGVSASAMPESDVMWNTIRFAAPRQAVMQKLNEAGMALPPSGKRRHPDSPDYAMEYAAEVTVDGADTVLDCN